MTETNWNHASSFIEELCEENRKFYDSERGRGLLNDLQQTFPRPWLYLGELLQNAVDAGAQHIKITVTGEQPSLIFEHDGKAFDGPDVRALCTRGVSTKGIGTVGFMGIGFKSVFHAFECADVSSGEWRFTLSVTEEEGQLGDRQRHWLGCVLPEVVPELEPPGAAMTCRFTLRRRRIGLELAQEDISKVLSEDRSLLAELARRGVTEFSVNDDVWNLAVLREHADGEVFRDLCQAVLEGGTEKLEWMLFGVSYQPSRAAVARFLEHRQIQPRPEEAEGTYRKAEKPRDVALICPLDSNGRPVPPERGKTFALLPAGAQCSLGLHIQADWLLVTTRQELMRFDANEWHLEIAAQIPRLIREFLGWVSSTKKPGLSYSKAYAVLPDLDDTGNGLSEFFRSPQFRKSLKQELEGLVFAPVQGREGVEFVAPRDGRFLPRPLGAFENRDRRPWELFGSSIISHSLLGDKAAKCLKQLGLYDGLSASELEVRWKSDNVTRWRGALGDAALRENVRLIGALADLDSDEAWKNAALKCLPATDGSMIDRHTARALPGEWGSIPAENPPVRSWLEDCLPSKAQRPEWGFDRALQADEKAKAYIAAIRRETLEQVMAKWWDSLSTPPAPEEVERILQVTRWVAGKQRNRPGLIGRLLCESVEGLSLRRWNEAVLADPYACHARRRFFPTKIPVSSCYHEAEANMSGADWRSFFEGAEKGLAGPFCLRTLPQILSKEELRRKMADVDPPRTKKVPMIVRWAGVEFPSSDYVWADFDLPRTMVEALNCASDGLIRADLISWLTEGYGKLRWNHKQALMYVPFGESALSKKAQSAYATWVTRLSEIAWIPAKDGSPPYRPSQLLAGEDAARPDAPVADLRAELISTLKECGIQFGTEVAQVDSVERLRREGPSALVCRLADLVEKAIADCERDPAALADLKEVIRTTPLFPGLPNQERIDGGDRFPGSRLVRRGDRDGDLGGWLLSIDQALKGRGAIDPHHKLYDLTEQLLRIPDRPTWDQALEFLRWAWKARSDNASVRKSMRVAYFVIAGGIDSEASQRDVWRESLGEAAVYLGSRKWLPAADPRVVFDDLWDEDLAGLLKNREFVAPGHLGDTEIEQRTLAGLLGIRLLSSETSVHLDRGDADPVPEMWNSHLRRVVEFVQRSTRDDQRPVVESVIAELKRFRTLRKLVCESEVVLSELEIWAAREGTELLVAGEPHDFAPYLAVIVLDWFGVPEGRFRQNLNAVVAQLLGVLDSAAKFERRIEEQHRRRGWGCSAPGGDIAPPAPKSERPEPTPPQRPASDAPGPQVESRLSQTGDTMPGRTSGGHSARSRESELKAAKRNYEQFLAAGPLPDGQPGVDSDSDDAEKASPPTDEPYREAVIDHERRHERFPDEKDATQPGFDIESYSHPDGHPDRRLLRRIEVKGREYPWEENQTVELTSRQFRDALDRKCSDAVTTADDFDYYLYVVERDPAGAYRVIEIRNPAARAKRFELGVATLERRLTGCKIRSLG